MRKSEAMKIRANIEVGAQSISDENALETVMLFPLWESDTAYAVGHRVRYDGVLYRCLTAHESQETWTPTVSPSLWVKVLIADDDTIPEWDQPESTNPYMTGDKVRYDGKVYVSICDNNVWRPTEYGWEEVGE